MGELTSHVDGDTLYLSGDIDLHQAQKFRALGEAHIGQTATPRLDMSRVPYLDSAGLATLLSLSRISKAQSKRLRIVATGSPRRVLRITGLDQVLACEDPE